MYIPNTQQWLDDPSAVRGIFVIITPSKAPTSKVYISNVGYLTEDASVMFSPIITGGVQLTESLTIDNTTSMSFGDIEVSNLNGELDTWLDPTKYIWVNSTIQVYLGDPFFACINEAAIATNFNLLFDGIVADIDARSRETLNIKLRDKLERLNTPLTEHTLGEVSTWNGQTNQNSLIPIVFGEVFNMSPLLVNAPELKYQFNDGASAELIEIRDNGIPLYTSGIPAPQLTYVTATSATLGRVVCNSTAGLTVGKLIQFGAPLIGGLLSTKAYYVKAILSNTDITISDSYELTTTVSLVDGVGGTMPLLTPSAVVDLANSKFILASPPVGNCTASVRGLTKTVDLTTGLTIDGYSNNVTKLIAYITTNYGKATTRFSSTDLDVGINGNLVAVSTSKLQPVGIVIYEKTNIIEVCQQLASSVGMQVFINRKGKLQLLGLAQPVSATTSITDTNILHHSLSISNRTQVRGVTKIGYCKNWTVQGDLITGIPTEHKTIYGDQWVFVLSDITATGTASIIQTYKLNVEVDQKDTMLLVKSDAQAEADRLTNYFKTPRTVYKFTASASLLSLVLGQFVYLVHNRFNLYNNGIGTLGQVISLSPNWVTSTIDIEVII